MPSGQAHRKLAAATAPLIVLGGWTISGFSFDLETWASIGIVTVGYLMNPVMLSPDMDLVHSDPSDEWRTLEPLWFVYQGIIHKGGGRNPLSHWPPLSSLLRVFYLWLVLFIAGAFGIGILDLVWYGLFEQVLVPWDWVKMSFQYWAMIFVFPQFWNLVWGIALGDLLHWGADILYSFMKK